MTPRKKRKHPRARAKGLSAGFIGPDGPMSCRVDDISLGGLFLVTDLELLPGTALPLTLLKPGIKKGIPLASTVANLRPAGPGRRAGIGVRFEGLTAEARSRLLVLLVELGLSNPVQPETDGSLEPPPLPRGPADLQRIDLKALHARTAAHTATPEGMPWAQEPAAPRRPISPENTAVMSSDEVQKHLEATLGGDWGESATLIPFSPAPPSSIPAAPYVPPLVPTPDGHNANDKLQLQIRGVLLQLGEAEQLIATQEQELQQLRERVAELSAAVRKKDAELAQLRRETGR